MDGDQSLADDVDEFLYGGGSTSTPNEQGLSSTTQEVEEEEDFQKSTPEGIGRNEYAAPAEENEGREPGSDDDDSASSTSDDDVEIVIEPVASTTARPSDSTLRKNSLVNAKQNQPVKAPVAVVRSDAPQTSPAPVSTSKATIDIHAVGQYEGKDIYDVDLESFDEKPWRKPGADITDYFNFGFNEQTWKAYCTKQKQMREEQNMQRRINVYESKMEPNELMPNMEQPLVGLDGVPVAGQKYQRLQRQPFPDPRVAAAARKGVNVGGKRLRDQDEAVIQVTAENVPEER
ncbi:cleavage polyadenylation factor subunit fip1 [Quaeritorhiza haematococci]|nr:cleavage polyadenylation factor subunit fip1 [Quaeritorhiza haematococci]